MATKRKRADEVTPKLHFRPGVNDPDLEATIVSFYRPREIAESLFPALLQDSDKQRVSDDRIAGSTVDHAPRSTVDAGLGSTVDRWTRATVDCEAASTVDPGSQPTVDPEVIELSALAVPSRSTVDLGSTVDWYTESPRNFFPAKRVRKITLAQDALSLTEEAVYDALWAPKNGSKDEFRLMRKGYDALHRETRISKRKVADILDRLTDKGFIQIETPPDIMHRTSTQYRVFGYRMALQNMRGRGRTHVVRSGNGVLFAFPLSRSTVDLGSGSTVDSGQRSTVDPGVRSTEDPGAESTVDPGATSSLGTSSLAINSDKTTTAAAAWPQTCRSFLDYVGRMDDRGVEKMVAGCLAYAPDIRDVEIADLVIEEAIAAGKRSAPSLSGAVITSVPLRCMPMALGLWREPRTQKKEAELHRLRYCINDPEYPETEKEELRRQLKELETQ